MAFFKFDLVAFVTGGMSYGSVNPFSRLIYILVAVAGVVAVTAIAELV